MAKGLTRRQRQVLNLIVRYIKERGYPPTLRDLQDELDIGTARGVLTHVKALERKGYLRRDSTPRGIQVLREADEKLDDHVTYLPLLGHVPAGAPVLAEQNVEDWIPWPKRLLPKHTDAFVLRAAGDSMIGDDIHSGDLLLVVPEPGAQAAPGDIVVALHRGEVTVKRLSEHEGRLLLEPSNPAHETIGVDEETTIQGKVIGRIQCPE